MKSNWNYPTTVWTGEDRSADLTEACLISKIKNPLFVTDKDLVTLPMTIISINNLKKVFKDIVFSLIFQEIHLGKILLKVLSYIININVMVL